MQIPQISCQLSIRFRWKAFIQIFKRSKIVEERSGERPIKIIKRQNSDVWWEYVNQMKSSRSFLNQSTNYDFSSLFTIVSFSFHKAQAPLNYKIILKIIQSTQFCEISNWRRNWTTQWIHIQTPIKNKQRIFSFQNNSKHTNKSVLWDSQSMRESVHSVSSNPNICANIAS